MKSITFRNLVLGFYVSLGITVFPSFYYSLEYLIDLLWWFSENSQNLFTAIFSVLFFVLVVITTRFRQGSILFGIYFGGISAFSIAVLGVNNGDKAVFGIILFSVLLLIISLAYHPSFKTNNAPTIKNETILDDFDTQEKGYIISKTSYFLRINRIFSFVIVLAALGLIFLGTFMTGGHISEEEGFGLILLSVPIFIIAFLNWKFPKVFSYLVAITVFIGGTFLELAILEQMYRSLFKNDSRFLMEFFVIGQVGFVLSCLFLIFIVLSKTAKEEWKMK
ncbi:hypothetical protein WAF17_07270 [Bernardetia sp. ABR2-2B]|uniref:hypothetical protein n=1 Tax=Bernardetia sp. ABR2-2B TaxID=3127472 RepID=UPI0030D496B5